jgi:serine/threonine protein kinase
MVGTEGYLPPEGPGTAAGDVFALGKVLEEMLRPRKTTDMPHPDVVPEHLRSVISRACAANPAERFPNARAMREALAGSAK